MSTFPRPQRRQLTGSRVFVPVKRLLQGTAGILPPGAAPGTLCEPTAAWPRARRLVLRICLSGSPQATLPVSSLQARPACLLAAVTAGAPPQ